MQSGVGALPAKAPPPWHLPRPFSCAGSGFGVFQLLASNFLLL
jgi:hypothetical protein